MHHPPISTCLTLTSCSLPWVGGQDVPDREALRQQVVDLFALDAFQRYLGRLPRRRMPGCDMLRFEHLVALGRAGFASAVRDYALLYALGELPDELRPYAYGGRLVAPSKPGATDEHLPLGAGVAWRRVAAGFLCAAHRAEFGSAMGPLQLGVGVLRGPEILALAMRLALESHPRWVAVKLDFKNAFNTCSRPAFLRWTAQHFPALLLTIPPGAAYRAPPYITAPEAKNAKE